MENTKLLMDGKTITAGASLEVSLRMKELLSEEYPNSTFTLVDMRESEGERGKRAIYVSIPQEDYTLLEALRNYRGKADTSLEAYAGQIVSFVVNWMKDVYPLETREGEEC